MGCGGSKSTSSKDDDAPDINPIEVPESEPHYPRPKPPTSKKKEIFKKEDYQEIDDKAKSTSMDNAATYSSLITSLTSDLKTDIQKVRTIFVWLGSQRIFDMTYPGVTDANIPRGYMKLIKKRKGTYTAFFALLCRAARIPCVIVRGKCKDADYEVGDTNLDDHNSSWNAVFVDNNWRIVHPYWAFVGVTDHETGRWTLIEDKGKGVRQKQEKSGGVSVYGFDEFFFLPDPEEFVYICMASKKEYQLLHNPWSETEFVTVPHFSHSYFSSGVKLTSEHRGLLKAKDGRTEISFKFSQNTDPQLIYKLFFDEARSEERLPKDVQLDMYVLQNNQDQVKTFIIRFPVKGIYKVGINNGMCNFRVDCEAKGKNANPFPIKPAIGFGFGQKAKSIGLTNPSNKSGVVILDYGNVKKFIFKSKENLEYEVFLKHYLKTVQNLHKYVNQEVNGDEVTVTVTMPDASVSNNPEYALEINAREKGSKNKFDNVCNYLIAADEKEWGKSTDSPSTRPNESKEQRQIRRRLQNATNGNDIDELDQAIVQFQEAGLEDRNDLTRARERLVQLRTKKLKGQEMADSRKRMVDAAAGDDVDALEKAVREFIKSGMSDQGDLTAAKERLVELHKKRLEEAAEKRDLQFLDESISSAEKSVVGIQLVNTEEMKEARRVQKQLKRLKRFLHKILALKPPTVSEIHSYKRPRPLIHDVMKATYLLLGERERELKNWEYVQSLMRRLGQESLIRRIKEFDVVNMSVPSAKRADGLLNKYELFDVRESSAGAGTFYVWSNNIIKEQRENN
ncbi:hillarin-like isoform X2 [Gigantopelta aegis]|uniref:hillarin-like isoform X2 n=1 Tax=Gigantopelta aegis TaxID=1735272 RepID=UPI001B888DA8|nr:hillarin-like isoform X2 [Gigantopelta aegis]